jgi:hypothetical protein
MSDTTRVVSALDAIYLGIATAPISSTTSARSSSKATAQRPRSEAKGEERRARHTAHRPAPLTLIPSLNHLLSCMYSA